MIKVISFAAVALLLIGGSSASAQSAREVAYTAQSIVPIHTKIRFTTLVILPEQEQILDFVCGDKEFWVVSGTENLAYIKPAKAGASTDLNLVTASGHVYSFVLSEGTGDPDLKVFITFDDGLTPSTGVRRRFYSAVQVEDLQQEVEDSRKAVDDARQQLDAARAQAEKTADERVNAFRASFPTTLKFPYRFTANTRPFNVSAIYTDGTFTYIRANPAELPALYELVDRWPRPGAEPNLIDFQVEHGVYVVPKVLERGYLVIGRKKLVFESVR
jgi:type IV secretion system protein VirB9